jgi:hypothetical protein
LTKLIGEFPETSRKGYWKMRKSIIIVITIAIFAAAYYFLAVKRYNRFFDLAPSPSQAEYQK